MYILVQLLTQIQLMQMVMVELTERFNGQVVETEHPVWGGKVITDLLHNFTKSKIVVGAQYLISILILTLDLQPQSDH
jgi:hypothetical protein